MSTTTATRSSVGLRAWAALGVIMLLVLLVSVNNTAINFALPAISAQLRPSAAQLLWLVDIYPLILAALLVPMGSLGDRVGRKKILMIGAIGFAATSLMAAFSPTAEWLLAARAGTAVFGSLLLPATLSIIRTVFHDERDRSKAIAIWVAGFSAGAALGPIAGGFLLDHFWWGSVFMLAVPVNLAFLATAPALLPESRDPEPGPVDITSIMLAIITMGAVVYGIKSFATGGSVLAAVLFLAVGLLMGLLFVRRQITNGYPMLDLRFFQSSRFTSGVLVNVVMEVAMIGFMFFLTQHLQLVMGFPAMYAALLMIPGMVLAIVTGLLAGVASRALGLRMAMVVGLLLVTAGLGIVAATDQQHSAWPVLIAFTVLSAGVGIAATLSTDLVVSSVPEAQAGAASAVSETAYEVGAVLGAALLGGLTMAFYQSHLDLPSVIDPERAEIAHETLGAAMDVAQTGPHGDLIREAASAAFSSGMQWSSLVGAVLLLVTTMVVGRGLRADRKVRLHNPLPTDRVEIN